ncbi:lysozyme inhibitor LprI family protein [Stenotrophomonas maltophilia]|uniref:lysozyme inhibitor LprI family protein n=1 Tax=Stenotrophomonas maltophilia TaxID=40324 RepID=UPI003BF831CB
MNTIKVLVALGMTVAAPMASAQNVVDLTGEFRSCIAGTDSQIDTSNCMSQELKRQDALVDAELRMARENARPEIATRMDQVQAAWLNFRKQECQTKQAAVVGSGATVEYLECMIHHAVLRKSQLANYWSL